MPPFTVCSTEQIVVHSLRHGVQPISNTHSHQASRASEKTGKACSRKHRYVLNRRKPLGIASQAGAPTRTELTDRILSCPGQQLFASRTNAISADYTPWISS